MDITIKSLETSGWNRTDDPIFPMVKGIENCNPLNDNPEDSGVKLVIHRMYNKETFAVLLPTGALLNFVVKSMAELKAFENAIDFYDPEY